VKNSRESEEGGERERFDDTKFELAGELSDLNNKNEGVRVSCRRKAEPGGGQKKKRPSPLQERQTGLEKEPFYVAENSL